MEAITALIKNDVRLPSPPAIAVRILEVVQQEDFSFNELGSIIQSDPALAGRIMRLANSGLYSLPRKVASIDKAISVLGINALKNIALSFVLSRMFQGPRGERFDFDWLWRRSITAAVAAELISGTIGFKSDETFIAALLQDIGIAVMFVCRSDDYLSVLDEKTVSGLPVTEVERKVFGFDHQEVGAELLNSWNLPESIYLTVRYHHDPKRAPKSLEKMCQVIRAADRLAAVYYGTGTAKNVQHAKDMLSKSFDMNEAACISLIDSVAERSIEVLCQFDIEPGKIKPFSQLLQEANQELSRLNLSYETLVIEHREAKQKAEQLAVELKRVNEKLRFYAFRDSMTGLYNYRYFQESMVRELARAERYKHSVALIMFDIDGFKAINDKHGHQFGDSVLRTIGQHITRQTRTSDILARYGGEEFAMILPETDLDGAKIKAERCRAMIEGLDIRVDSVVIRATISGGVAAHEPMQPISKEKLIDGADRALYRSKIDGRNRVTAWQWRTFVEVPRST